ncbi:MAG: BrnT family toxin [Beijerinckiaceae bacterium]
MFIWDQDKARQNILKHGIAFEEAKAVFSDPHAFIRYDDRFDYGEDRMVVIRLSAAKILCVVAVERDGPIRIISARKATKEEANVYFKAAHGG